MLHRGDRHRCSRHLRAVQGPPGLQPPQRTRCRGL